MELESLNEEMEEASTAYWELEKICLEMLNCHSVCKYQTMMPKGDFIKQNNERLFREEVEKLEKRLRDLGVLLKSPASDPRKKYKWSGDPKKWVKLIKLMREDDV